MIKGYLIYHNDHEIIPLFMNKLLYSKEIYISIFFIIMKLQICS